MKCVPVLSLTLASAMLVATGCKKDTDQAKPADEAAPDAAVAVEPSGDPNEVIASVGDARFLRKDMDEMLAMAAKTQNFPPDQRDYFERMLARQFILKNVLMAEANRQKIVPTDEDRTAQKAKMEESLAQQGKTMDDFYKTFPFGEKAAKADIEEGLLINKLIEQDVLSKIAVEQADIDKVMEDVKAQNAQIEEANKNLDTANAEAKKKIEDIKKQLDGGADFAELAQANSDCPSSQKGGDLGEFARGMMVKPFEDAAFTQEIGKVGDVVETQFGYHLIKVTAKSPAVEAQGDTPAKPEAVTASHILVKIAQAQQPQQIPAEEQLREYLKGRKSQEAVQKYIEEKKAAVKFETIFKDLDI